MSDLKPNAGPLNSISPEILAEIQENPIAADTKIKSVESKSSKQTSLNTNTEAINPIITVLLGLLAMTAGVLTVLVIANYARLQ